MNFLIGSVQDHHVLALFVLDCSQVPRTNRV